MDQTKTGSAWSSIVDFATKELKRIPQTQLEDYVTRCRTGTRPHPKNGVPVSNVRFYARACIPESSRRLESFLSRSPMEAHKASQTRMTVLRFWAKDGTLNVRCSNEECPVMVLRLSTRERAFCCHSCSAFWSNRRPEVNAKRGASLTEANKSAVTKKRRSASSLRWHSSKEGRQEMSVRMADKEHLARRAASLSKTWRDPAKNSSLLAALANRGFDHLYVPLRGGRVLHLKSKPEQELAKSLNLKGWALKAELTSEDFIRYTPFADSVRSVRTYIPDLVASKPGHVDTVIEVKSMYSLFHGFKEDTTAFLKNIDKVLTASRQLSKAGKLFYLCVADGCDSGWDYFLYPSYRDLRKLAGRLKPGLRELVREVLTRHRQGDHMKSKEWNKRRGIGIKAAPRECIACQ